ncbi:Zinc finger CCHC-type protein [Venturia nashicola]|uniref:Zinc finger CCHC-type protein n=1 Tax=Venturia nashicola TaxID=86259 RepID=A0A4Z1NTE7_9PEZI|nr:Zinc finger CCHC-type protein [Venturia nashicola]
MDYLAFNDEGVEDEVRAVATQPNDPEEDSRTATFSLRGSKRASPEVVIIAKDAETMDVHQPVRSSKRQKTNGAMQDLNKMSLSEGFDRIGQGHTYREWDEERAAIQADTTETTSLASGRPRRTTKTKQQKTSSAISKPKQTHEKVTSSTSGPALGTRSHQAPKPSTESGATGSTSMDGVESSSSAPRQTSGKKYSTQVRIANLATKVTLEELQEFLVKFNHDPFSAFSMEKTKEKRKKGHSLLINFQSLAEAQRAVKELQGQRIRSRKVVLSYEKGAATEPQTALAPQPMKKAASQPCQKPQSPGACQAIEILSDDEEGEIDENAPAQTLALPATGRAEENHQIKLINDAARQMAARVCKGKFKLDRTQQNFQQGLALLLSVQWPTVAAARKTVPRNLLRRRLYGIIPFARYDKIRVCWQPTTTKATDPEKCIVVYRSQAATTAAETYLRSKEFTVQNLSFTIEVERSEEIQESAAIKAAAYRAVPKGVDRESLAIGIAGAARKEIAHGMYTTKKYLTYCSNPQVPLFVEKPGVIEAPNETEVATRPIESNVNNNNNNNNNEDAMELSPPTTTIITQIATQAIQNPLNMSPSSSLTDLPIPARSIMSQLNEQERKLQTKYNFIERDDEVVFCPLCNERGHMDETCSQRACKHCGIVDDHLDISCPKHMKCGKCQERGHIEADCPAKLRRTAADGFIDCDICGGDGHKEENCPNHFIMMFKPPSEPRKVDSINVCCYACAGPHFGDDCLDRDKMVRKRAPLTESMHVFAASFANRFLNTPLGPVKRYHHPQTASNGRPPAASSRRGGRFPHANGRTMNHAINLDDAQDSLDDLPRRAPPRAAYIPPPPPDDHQPPLPPGPPPPSSSRHYQPPPLRYDPYRGNDGYVPYQGNNSYSDRPRSYNNVAPPNYPQQQQQQSRRRSRSPSRRRGGGYMGMSDNYRDRDEPSYPRGNNSSMRGPPPGPPGSHLGGYSVRR